MQPVLAGFFMSLCAWHKTAGQSATCKTFPNHMLTEHLKQLHAPLPRTLTSATSGYFYVMNPASLHLCLFPFTWAYVATGVFVPDWCLAESRGTHFSVAQDTPLPAGAACALVQVPGLPLHVKLPPRCSAHHHVHSLWLTAAWLI